MFGPNTYEIMGQFLRVLNNVWTKSMVNVGAKYQRNVDMPLCAAL